MTGPSSEIETLIDILAKLPGLGPRSARRAALHLIKKRERLLVPLAEAMRAVGETVRECVRCGNLGTADLAAREAQVHCFRIREYAGECQSIFARSSRNDIDHAAQRKVSPGIGAPAANHLYTLNLVFRHA